MLQPSGEEGQQWQLADRLRCNRHHRLVKSGNRVVEEVVMLGLKSMEVLLMEMVVVFGHGASTT